MHARVTDLTLGEILCETDIPAEQFISGEYVGLLFENSQTGVKDHEYEIDLTFSRELWNSGLEVMTSHRNLCVNAYLYFNIFLKKFFFFMFLGVEGLICLFWYLAFVRKVRVETLFLVTVLGLGLFYNVLITPQMVPDEAKHIDMAYRYSNELLGYESLGDTTCLMRADDAAMAFTSSPSFKNYRNIYYGLFSRVQDDRMVEADINSNIEGSILFYAPAVLGMTLARLLHLGTVPMLLLARYLNLAVFALLTWLGMRRLPFGKTTLFLISVLPVNLQQCTSFSHDAMVHGILFLYGSLCLEAIYVKEKLTGQKMLLLAVLGVAAVYCKSGSYLPMVLLTLLIPAAAYGSRQMKLFGTCSLFGTVLLTFLMKNAAVVRGITGTTEATSVVTSVAGSGSGDAVYATLHDCQYNSRQRRILHGIPDRLQAWMGGDRDFGDAGSALFVPAVFIHLNYTGKGGVDKQCAERNHDHFLPWMCRIYCARHAAFLDTCRACIRGRCAGTLFPSVSADFTDCMQK